MHMSLSYQFGEQELIRECFASFLRSDGQGCLDITRDPPYDVLPASSSQEAREQVQFVMHS